MPIILNDKKKQLHEMRELRQKREARDAKRTKYQIQRKDRTPEEYKGIQLIIDGKEIEISDSAKFLLEQMIAEQEIKGDE